ncbi:ATP-grasp domain-containing protein [Myxococcus stipitatus]|uniref:ATP-grasp domain-containing protein n=1 Tax=Myxococcus stipitatus TaxID=83455 RepID=UPI001F386FD6|nr:ATP-grasp domain-containing protein [Myxococcus stipitatus]MCE9673348.1 ATP-grasp domain-containing protein [Myxococcus stipitatus]
MLTAPTGKAIYDFAFDTFFACRRPYQLPSSLEVVARVGVWNDYAERYRELENEGLRLIHSPEQHLLATELPHWYPRLADLTPKDPILHWQRVVCRELRPLRRVEEGAPDRIPSSFEFRTFWWRGELVGWGPYWWQGSPYTMNEAEQREALALGREVARRVDVPFLVVDVAQEVSGRWIVIECNDGQESGFAGISPFALWRNILEREAAR